MSDCIVKIMPLDPFCKISKPLLQKCRDFLEAAVPCDTIEVKCSETPMFIDCGSNLERIVCPECLSELSFDWWGDAMDQAGKKDFTALDVQVPCCKKTVSLNDLEYDSPCGFACREIDMWNPSGDLEKQVIDFVQRILGTDVRIIKAHI